MEYEDDGDTNCNWYTRYNHQRIGTGAWGLENKKAIVDHPNYSIIKIDQNSEKNLANLRKFAVTQKREKNLFIKQEYLIQVERTVHFMT